MRKIKFRVWDYNSGRFVIPYIEGGHEYQFEVASNCSGKVRVVRRFLGELDGEESNVEIQQFISLLDKDGAEIYEGDLVKLFGDDEEVFEVVYDDYDDFPNPAFILENHEGRGDWFSRKDREVIGNIFENPNLLNASTT